MKKIFSLIILMVIFVMTAAACGMSAKEKEEQEKIKELAGPLAVELAKDMDGKELIIDEYKFSSKIGGGTIFVRGHYEGEKSNFRSVQVVYNPENIRDMEARGMSHGKEKE
ncbi:hypothetical protein GKZ89_16115 [Bacillus mangrovi]|uniref:DUF1433 domain-containing protein n=1 Tax=Metabacillus mangrovi TaxID=1491830 RepID=A0A7X2V6C0_9BACI|nr:hypothetical protein [Metabacillus mangrovi]MTH54928.1 hypothetical protein [Metabacillus mangrovi]